MPRPTWGHVSDERGENEEDARGDGDTWHVATQRTGCGHVSTKWQPGSWSADPWLCKNIFVDILVDMFVDVSGRYTLYLLGCHRRVPVSSPLQQPPRVSDSSIETRVGHSSVTAAILRHVCRTILRHVWGYWITVHAVHQKFW